MVEHIAIMGQALTAARKHRADPNGVLSASDKLQAIKLENIQLQLKHGAFAKYSELPPGQRVVVDRAIAHFNEVQTDEERNTCFNQILAALLNGTAELGPKRISQ